MFNLDQDIEQWRRQMAADGIKAPEILNELESHLRDDFEQQTRAGAGAAQAFENAVRRIGQAGALQHEFAKINGTTPERVRHALLTLAGIPTLATNMNTTNINIEPRWVTYLKAAVFLVPAIILWALAVVFVFPKLQQVCRDVGVTMPGIFGVTQFVTHHALLICLAVILGLIGLEWRAARWPKYRRASIGVAVFLLNTSVMILIFVMVVLALLAVGR